MPGALAGSTFLKAVSIDLDGDGRDEVVTANRIGTSGGLKLGVFGRTGLPGVQLLDTWTVDFGMDAEDFDRLVPQIESSIKVHMSAYGRYKRILG